jgi:hypothetical protein
MAGELGHDPLLEESLVEVGSMDPGVAVCAGRQLRRSSTHTVNRACRHRAVALIAQHIDIRHVQQPSVLRTMRSMAPHAPFRLDCGVLKDERSARLRMAFGADQVLIDGGPQVIWFESAMHVMAVAAADRAFGHRVVERHREGPLHVGVAPVAELRLGNLEQARFCRKGMHAVATGAGYPSFGVRRTLEVGVHSCVTTEACGINLLGRCLGESKDFCHVPAALNVSLARPMAAFAGNTLSTMQQGETRVWIGGKAFSHICVAGHAGIGTDEVGCGSIDRTRALRGPDLLLLLRGGIYPHRLPES